MKHTLITAIFGLFLSSAAFASHEKVEVKINGLVCDFCARSVEKVFGRKAEVASVQVDLDSKYVHVTFHDGQTLDDATLTQLMTDAGYTVVAIERRP
jgi:copper chaperone CopZ